MHILTSWDDGHPCDSRLAEILYRHGLRGTFFVPRRNSEGLPVMQEKEIRQLGEVFEIGGHTLDHTYLDSIDSVEATRQVRECKNWLEDVLSASISGFCYPGGVFTKTAVAAVRDAGFKYARTVENMRCDLGMDAYKMATTVQFYPHPARLYFKNFLSGGEYRKRFGAMCILTRKSDFSERLRDLAITCNNSGGVFHLWGHSWEIEMLGLWNVLDDFIGFLASLPHQVINLSDVW